MNKRKFSSEKLKLYSENTFSEMEKDIAIGLACMMEDSFIRSTYFDYEIKYDNQCNFRVLYEYIKSVISGHLTEREKTVLPKYYNLDAKGLRTCKNIADELSISAGRVQNIKNNALRKIKLENRFSVIKEILDGKSIEYFLYARKYENMKLNLMLEKYENQIMLKEAEIEELKEKIKFYEKELERCSILNLGIESLGFSELTYKALKYYKIKDLSDLARMERCDFRKSKLTKKAFEEVAEKVGKYGISLKKDISNPDDILIANLDCSTKLVNPLKRVGILKLADIRKKKPKELLEVRGFGVSLLKELILAVYPYGIVFDENELIELGIEI